MYAIRHFDDLTGFGREYHAVGDAPTDDQLLNLLLDWFVVLRGLADYQYSRSYYRATYVNTAFDAGFASAMAIRPKWLKDLASVVFAAYYLIWANEGDDVVRWFPNSISPRLTRQLRKFRALCTVEMLRVTWEKTRNPYVSNSSVMSKY